MPTNSAINLNIGQVPKIADIELYTELLDIHNALEILAARGSNSSIDFNDFISKYLSVQAVGADYTVTAEDNLILVNTSTGDVTVTLISAASVPGYEFTIKCVDGTNIALIAPYSTETIDTLAGTMEIFLHDSITLKSDGTDWQII